MLAPPAPLVNFGELSGGLTKGRAAFYSPADQAEDRGVPLAKALMSSSVGSYYGKYFLLKKIAAGGMGEIFLAKQQGPAGYEKILVIKRILGHLAEDKTFVESFLGEARLTARMSHRNIVQIFDLGEHDDGSYFIAMEYVQGKPMRDALDVAWGKQEKMHPSLVKDVIMQSCDGLSYAHNMTDVAGRPLNIIHRDVNPQNLLVSYSGDVKIIDFGIAKSEMSMVKTESGMIKGKFVYMSPEQSSAKRLDKRSDVFAVGIMMYECLCGFNPFQKDNVVLSLEAIQRMDPAPPSEMDPELAPFDPIVAKALAKNRDERYADCMDLRDDLSRIQLPPAPERLGQWTSRLFRQQLEEEQKMLIETDASRLPPPEEEAPADEEGPPPEGGTMIMDTRGRQRGAETTAGRRATSGPHARPTSGPHTRPSGARAAATTSGQRRVQRPEPEPEAEEPVAGSTQMANPDLLRQMEHDRAAKGGSKMGLILGIVGALVLIAGGGIGFMVLKSSGGAEAAVTELKPVEKTPEQLAAEKAAAERAAADKAAAEKAAGEKAAAEKAAAEKEALAKAEKERLAALQAAKPDCNAGEVAKLVGPAPNEEWKCVKKAEPRLAKVGQLKINAMPRTSLSVDGRDSGMTGGKVGLSKRSGSVVVGAGGAPYTVTLNYEVDGGQVNISVASEPWAIVYVNNLSRGRTPLGGLKVNNDATRIDLKRPGQEASMTIILTFESTKEG